MKRMFAAMLLALLGLPAIESSASAQNQGPFGCGGFCFKFLGGLHQHGPLFNYGPYEGYYPFAPYGPWTSDLQYTGPGLNGATCGPLGCGHGRGCGAAGCGVGGRGCGAAGCSAGGFSTGFGAGQRFGFGDGQHFGDGHRFGDGQHFGFGSGGNLRSLFGGGLRERGSNDCGSCANAPADSPLGFFAKVFKRSHPCSNKAKVGTGCSAAPACQALPACGAGTPVELAKPCGGCSASARTAPILQTVSGFGEEAGSTDARYRRER